MGFEALISFVHAYLFLEPKKADKKKEEKNNNRINK